MPRVTLSQLQDEIIRLKADNAALRQDASAWRDNAPQRLLDEINDEKARNKELLEEVDELKDIVGELEARGDAVCAVLYGVAKRLKFVARTHDDRAARLAAWLELAAQNSDADAMAAALLRDVLED